jgi:dolichyl-phosphate-mannose--protein O-mannosyl transferase
MSTLKFFCILLIAYCIYAHDHGQTAADIANEVAGKTIYYGSTVRIQNERSGFHLHSHDLKYGSGSNQQSVTGMRDSNDYNSLWTIKHAAGNPYKLPSEKVLCGDSIRLEHALTRRNLHSHDFQSPVSGRSEVSCFGEDGNGDGGDNWQIVCDGVGEGSPLKGYTKFYLQHGETKRYLYTDTRNSFNQRNCGHHCPIMGQLEISCENRQSNEAKWRITSGLFYLFDDDASDDNPPPNSALKFDKNVDTDGADEDEEDVVEGGAIIFHDD